MQKNIFILIFIGLSSLSCVQIPFDGNAPETYKKVDYSAPKKFTSLKASSSDEAWVKNSNGNIISYRTECPTEVRNLKDFAENLTSSLVKTKITNEESLQYNNRAAYRLSFDAETEGIPTRYDLILFKKYGCLFIITHNGKLKSLNETASDFESFLNSFKVTQ